MIRLRQGLQFILVSSGCLIGSSVWAAQDGTLLPRPDPLPEQSDFLPQMLDQPGGNPADLMRPERPQSQPVEPTFTHTWELPPVNVPGERPPELREEERVGSYAQPRWTTERRFSETRVYVRPEGSLEFEYWLIPTVERKGPSEIKNQFELEFGLPSRLQLDLYLVTRKEGSGGPTFVDYMIEMRYALADWNVIWGNPTIYLEYAAHDQAPDTIEAKLLLGGQIVPRWHWGANLSYEHETGGEMTNEYEITGGVSYTLLDERFSVGGEVKFNVTDTHARRGSFVDNTLVGPSIQYRPFQRMHIDFAPLIGVTHESPALQAFLIIGWDF